VEDGTVYHRDRPLVAEAVTNRHERHVTQAVVVGEHVVARFIRSRPSVEVAATNGIPVPRLDPPRGRRRDDGKEGEWLVGGDGTAVRYVELDGRRLLHYRQREAARIESDALRQPRRALAELVP
jgi:hypothetical protein